VTAIPLCEVISRHIVGYLAVVPWLAHASPLIHWANGFTVSPFRPGFDSQGALSKDYKLFLTADDLALLFQVDSKTILRHKELRSFSLDLGYRIVRWYAPDVEDYLTRLKKGGHGAHQGLSEGVISIQPYLLARQGEGAAEDNTSLGRDGSGGSDQVRERAEEDPERVQVP
jgi:hypothetical protein